MRARLTLRSTLVALGFILGILQGCVSLQYLDEDGRPHLVGIGSVEEIEIEQGRLFKVVAPGVSLRTSSHNPGLGVGWTEELVFLPDSDPLKMAAPAAFQTTVLGIGLGLISISVGYDRLYAIPFPESDAGVVQRVTYSGNDPSKTAVTRKAIE